MRGCWQELAGLVTPVVCAGCGRPDTGLCASCSAVLTRSRPRRVRPTPEPAGLPGVCAAVPYADGPRAVLISHKERGVLRLAAPLGAALAAAVRVVARPRLGPGPVLLVPVPSARRAVAARGHDPTRRVARAAAVLLRRSGLPAHVLPVVRQRREVADQARLGAAQRLLNVAGAIGVVAGGARAMAVGQVVLVDDVMTTGASLAEAARAVRAAGAAGVGPSRRGPAGAGGETGGVRLTGAAVVAASASAFVDREEPSGRALRYR